MNDIINSVLLTSGGLDSTTLAYWLLEKNIAFMPLFIDYGQHCAETEYNTLYVVLPSEIKKNIQRIDISDIYRLTGSLLIREANLWTENVVSDELYLPYRNLLLLSVAAAFATASGY